MTPTTPRQPHASGWWAEAYAARDAARADMERGIEIVCARCGRGIEQIALVWGYPSPSGPIIAHYLGRGRFDCLGRLRRFSDKGKPL